MKKSKVFAMMTAVTSLFIYGCGGTPTGNDSAVRGLAVETVKGHVKEAVEGTIRNGIMDKIKPHLKYYYYDRSCGIDCNDASKLSYMLEQEFKRLDTDFTKEAVDKRIERKYWSRSKDIQNAMKEAEYKELAANKAKFYKELMTKADALNKVIGKDYDKMAANLKALGATPEVIKSVRDSNKTLEKNIEHYIRVYNELKREAFIKDQQKKLLPCIEAIFKPANMSDGDIAKVVTALATGKDSYSAIDPIFEIPCVKSAMDSVSDQVMKSIPVEINNVRVEKVDDKIGKSTNIADLHIGEYKIEIVFTAQSNADSKVYVEVFSLPNAYDFANVYKPYIPQYLK